MKSVKFMRQTRQYGRDQDEEVFHESQPLAVLQYSDSSDSDSSNEDSSNSSNSRESHGSHKSHKPCTRCKYNFTCPNCGRTSLARIPKDYYKHSTSPKVPKLMKVSESVLLARQVQYESNKKRELSLDFICAMSRGMETTITDQQLDALLEEKTMRRMTYEQLKYSLNGMICEVKRKRGFGWVEEDEEEKGKDRLREFWLSLGIDC